MRRLYELEKKEIKPDMSPFFLFISVKTCNQPLHKRANLILKRSRLLTSNQTRFLSSARIKII